MKFICNKQITGVVSVSQYGKMHSVKINDNPIEELAAQGCEIKSMDLMFATLPYATISAAISVVLYLICGFMMV